MGLTLAHEVFEVVPFDVVGEVADVDTTLLLRALADVAHHLLLVRGTVARLAGLSVAIGGGGVASLVVAVLG